ncbi:MAG: sorbosone dehydrogenase family protein [Ignavibacteria bacterium]|nr:sorbosone dehydrogenase family protein [Ignavibacteria bacterium]MBT8392773.1 sorbosone dehydrogenase family protein [Ignavibacteria bacterium]NNJ54334.1 sorbosone dehydrogenase family protein [Ignavibacteriaceae bacterium]NNL22032.1 sorbosone dehydrogenase family protein [Ignavibacteriaceae bacterium]
MNYVLIFGQLFLIILISIVSVSCNPNDIHSNGSGITLPPGFKIEVYASNVDGARSMALSKNGILFVGTREVGGDIYALIDKDNDYKADEVVIVASGLNMPNGVAIKDGHLYVSEVNRILKFENIEKNFRYRPVPEIIRDDFPTERHHGWKFIRFGPDGKLYVPVGAPCNICDEEDERFASITRMNPDGSEFEIFAHGVRNSVGFDFHPSTRELWLTDNGRDWLGDNLPPDELNHAPQIGLHFGFPYLHGKNILDSDFGEGVDTSQFTKPVQELSPHVAALGMRFYSGNMFPEEYQNQIFIAEHGSWNRTEKIGYRVMLVRLNGNTATSYEPFAEGWLKGESVSGRPVDVQQMPDGSLLVSDDYAGVIYRITYEK